ncbi:hypothetical protein GOODEAATRI_016362 [Goodea atripinnis]|uniref:Ig-like domain-containing protein n=1 Tax=Goodea atripinnis TaxID=208336 RepID=A0ABV0NKT6_9TELE
MPSTSASIFINNTQLSDTGTYQCLVNNFPDGGGRNIGVIGLTVLVPACRIQGTLDVGSDIMLFCSSDEGIPTPSYSWEKLDALPKLPHNAMQDQMQGTVTLRNISTSTSGLYQCTSSNAIGKSTCVLNLEVVAHSFLLSVFSPCSPASECRSNRRDHCYRNPRCHASSSENDTLTSTNTYNSRYWHNPKTNYDTNSYTRYNGDTRQTFTAAPATAAHGPHGAHSHGRAQNATQGRETAVTAPGSTPLTRHPPPTMATTTTTSFANGGHMLSPPKTLVVTTNSAPSPPAMVRSNGTVSLKPVVTSSHGHHTHSYAVSQATLERMGAVPVMVPAQSRAGSLV